MEKGTEFTHNLTGEHLFLKKDFGQIVSCYSKHYKELSPGRITSVVICDKDNLTTI